MEQMANIKHLLDKIRTAIYGKEVRGSLADGLQAVNNESEDAKEISVNVEQRQDAVEEQFDDVLSELSDDREVDNAETIAARTNRVTGENHKTLGIRLDEENKKVTQQLADADKQRHFESMINRKEPDGLYCSWVDDDGWSEVYDRFKPILVDYGIPITSALITDRFLNSTSGTYLTKEQADELQKLGMEFISHTHWHGEMGHPRPIDMSEEELDEDFRLSQKAMKDLGYNFRGMALPFGDNSDLIQKVARRYFDYVIGTGSSKSPESGKVLYPGKIDNYYITRVSVERGFNYVKERLDEAAEKGIGYIVFVSHIYTEWYSDEYVRQIIGYAQSLGFKFCTTQEGVERFGNIAQFGDNKIGADGSVHGNELGRVQYRPLSKGITNETPLTDFPENVISFTDINSPNSDGFPRGLTGTLFTYRITSIGVYSFQKYVTSRDYRTYARNWEGSEWGDWVAVGGTHFLGINKVKSDTPAISNPLVNKNSYVIINHEGNDGFPEGKSGILKTFSFTIDGFPMQEYHIFHESTVYKRWWDNSNSKWGDWISEGTAMALPRNSVNGDKLIEEYDVGITITWINANGDRSGLPSEQSGILMTYKQSPDTPAFNYQEFKKYNSFDKYLRYAKEDGNWSTWKKIVLEDA